MGEGEKGRRERGREGERERGREGERERVCEELCVFTMCPMCLCGCFLPRSKEYLKYE